MGRKLCISGRKVSPSVTQNRYLSLQTLLQDKFGVWASNGSRVEEIWNNFKDTVSKSIKRFVPNKLLRKTLTVNTTGRKLNI